MVLVLMGKPCQTPGNNLMFNFSKTQPPHSNKITAIENDYNHSYNFHNELKDHQIVHLISITFSIISIIIHFLFTVIYLREFIFIIIFNCSHDLIHV